MQLCLFYITAFLAGALLLKIYGQAQPEFHDLKAIDRIAFGSCFNPREKQFSIFDGILKQTPDVFIFLGDNIYGDTHDMEVLRKKYHELGSIQGYQQLKASAILLATWDDHDFGIDDGGKSYAEKIASERALLDFFGDSQQSIRRQREGVYGSYLFGPEGKRCQILLLDTRYFRDELQRNKKQPEEGTLGWYEPTDDCSKSLLGEAQWQWLDEQLQVPADIRIIASSIQVLAHEKGMENWGNVPHERQRLFDLLKQHKADHTFAISGDVHFSELSMTKLGDYPFYDFTSSGMSQTSKDWAHAINSFRIGEPKWDANAGLIDINWEEQSIQLSIINAQGEKLFTYKLDLHELKFR